MKESADDADTSVLFLDMQASLAPTLVRPSVGKSLRDTFRIWDLTKRRDDIAAANIVADMLNALRACAGCNK